MARSSRATSARGGSHRSAVTHPPADRAGRCGSCSRIAVAQRSAPYDSDRVQQCSPVPGWGARRGCDRADFGSVVIVPPNVLVTLRRGGSAAATRRQQDKRGNETCQQGRSRPLDRMAALLMRSKRFWIGVILIVAAIALFTVNGEAIAEEQRYARD